MNNKVIDLSHNNVIAKDLIPAREAGVLGVIQKITEGMSLTDNTSRSRCQMAKDAGLLFGLYHFLRPGNVGQQAARFVAKSEVLMDDNTLLACDFEVDGIPLTEVLKFLQFVESATGRIPVLYSGHTLKELSGCHALPPLARYRLWLAQYGPKAVLPKGYDKYFLWQYSETGKIPGIGGTVDLNNFDGSDEDLAAQWSGRH